MAKNSNLHAAKVAKNDEFYTRYEDIEKEIYNYRNFFEGKTVLCNCDDPMESNFTKYFILNFHFLKLKKLYCTFYDISGKMAYVFVYEGQDMNGDGIINGEDIEEIIKMKAFRHRLVDDMGFDFEHKEECWAKGIYGSGDFRSQHCIEYLKMSDVVVTNPPFSLFREYIKQLMDYGKKFLIIGNGNAVTYKEIFPLIKENKLWLGVSKGISSKGGAMMFNVPNTYEGKYTEIIDDKKYAEIGNACWFTNIEHKKRNTPLDLYKRYSNEYPKYDNYDAIDSKTDDIPVDYNGVIGVPITFLDKYCPEQFEIVGLMSGAKGENLTNGNDGKAKFYIDGKGVYARILIKKSF